MCINLNLMFVDRNYWIDTMIALSVFDKEAPATTACKYLQKQTADLEHLQVWILITYFV